LRIMVDCMGKKKRTSKKSGIKLDLGCGLNKKEGYIGVDAMPYPGVEYICDVDKGIPFKDNSVDEIYTSHFLEHVKDFQFVMEEIWRVMKPNGVVEIIVPHWASSLAYSEYHVRFFRYLSFEELTDNSTPFKGSFKAKFEIRKRRYIFNYRKICGRFGILAVPYSHLMELFSNEIKGYFDIWFAHLFPPSEVYFKLEVIK